MASILSSDGQKIYFSSIYDIWRLNPEDCSYGFVINIDRALFDMAFDTAGNFYGISGNRLLKINTINGNYSTVTTFPSGLPYNAMTISAQNIVYVGASQGELYSYNLNTGVQAYLGNMGYGAAGDFTFYKGEMYMAARFNQLIKVNIHDASLSTLVFSYNVNGKVLGIVSDFKDCDEVECYAISNIQGDSSEIYKINFDSQRLEYICVLPQGVDGGASTTEFMASIQAYVGDVIITPANCQNENGGLEIVNSAGHGDVEFSINNGPYQPSNVFSDLSQGSYLIRMIDQLGCQDSVWVVVDQTLSPTIDSVLTTPSFCNQSNGQLSIAASGGEGALSYSLDGNTYQSAPIFDQLSPGVYTIWVRDTAGCLLNEEIHIESQQSANILSVEATSTSCGKDNGIIDITVDNETGAEYSLDGLLFQSNSLFQNLEAKTYLVTIRDKDGCLDTISAEVLSSTIPQIEIVDSSPASCNQSNGSITMSGNQGIDPYLFNVDGSGFSDSDLFDSLAPGQHKAVIQDAVGCINTIDFQITTTDAPTFKSIKVNPASCLKDNGSIVVEAGGGISPLKISLFSSKNEMINNFNALSPGNYVLNVEDNTGCVLDSLITIYQVDCPVYIPNVFSPNGDGINDNFLIEHLETGNALSSEISIFDRWGNMVYQQSNQGGSNVIADWNGNFKGHQCSSGVYAYLIILRHDAQENEVIKGEVTLIR